MTGILHLTPLTTCFLNFWFFYENKLLIWPSEMEKGMSFVRVACRKMKSEKITVLGTALSPCIACCMEERCLSFS